MSERTQVIKAPASFKGYKGRRVFLAGSGFAPKVGFESKPSGLHQNPRPLFGR